MTAPFNANSVGGAARADSYQSGAGDTEANVTVTRSDARNSSVTTAGRYLDIAGSKTLRYRQEQRQVKIIRGYAKPAMHYITERRANELPIVSNYAMQLDKSYVTTVNS